MKRRYSDIQNCQASQQWFASKFGAGGAPALAGFKAKSLRKPKIPCQGFSIDSGAQCTNRTHHRTTNGPTFALCPRHDNDFMRVALKLVASVNAHGLGALLRTRNDDGTLLRMAATTWCRRGPPAKSLAGGFVYFYERTGKSMLRAMYMSSPALTIFFCAGARVDVDLAGGTMVKVGADHAKEDDHTEERISKHEKAPCRAEINRCFMLLRKRNVDGLLLRMAAPTWCRGGPPAKSVAGGFVYFYERTGKSMSRAMYKSARALTVFVCAGARVDVDLANGTMVKVGADHAQEDDDIEERISKHEKAPCREEINRCFISDYVSEVAAMERLAHDLLTRLRVPPQDVGCPAPSARRTVMTVHIGHCTIGCRITRRGTFG
ncbi:hypothetical protein HDU88_001204 [Geranomyces variabilis]|nr:hypothetical protein HDU88_001204 [Geranomyces variabilis]